MVIVWLLLWIWTVIFLIKDYKTESTLWIAAVSFFTGLGAFTVVFQENIIEYFILKYDISQGIMGLMYSINGIIMAIVYSTTPYCMLLYGLSCANIIHKSKKKIIYTILFIPPILNYIFLPIKSSYLKTPEELMLYFRGLAIWTVPYIVGGIFFLVYSYIKEKSYMMKKYKLLTIIIVVPCFSYTILSNVILRAFGIENNWRYFAILIPIEFMGFLYFAFKYGILGVRLKFDRYKFAFENILEFVSDSIITLDEELNVIEFNKVFIKNFLLENRKYKNFNEIISSSRISEHKTSLINLINDSKNNNIKSMEIFIKIKGETKYFQVQSNPIILNSEYLGTVLVFKDITVYKKNLELIKQNQLQLIEKERLLSLSQLIGGVAHNLKTPLMSSAGGMQIIKKDTGKIYEYIQKNCDNATDISKLVEEINDWQQRITEYLVYMSDVITAVKGQVTEYNEVEESCFSIKELEEKITLLMAFEIKKSKCVFVKKLDIDSNDKIKGDINSLVQVLNNLISNAIEASKQGNVITLGAYKEEKKVIFYIKNFGQKIPEKIQRKIFNKMVTTKGKKGTGLGLYISKSIIKVRFNGEIGFETNDKETTFFVKIPLIEED
ncbi:ATP-binding protein [Tepidibacter hydrothermalis]|uniref:histidine kinase n=1 Tax=Tepidibacter hydrothermalis TaxID=3036126 RepID=A0ABY8EH32_9FIRM|nr:ATP-binding protein [Tepidibacter hydrothermalis]WFD10894.1 ATP-binding protein [Tepidibacter hydrothermalis]